MVHGDNESAVCARATVTTQVASARRRWRHCFPSRWITRLRHGPACRAAAHHTSRQLVTERQRRTTVEHTRTGREASADRTDIMVKSIDFDAESCARDTTRWACVRSACRDVFSGSDGHRSCPRTPPTVVDACGTNPREVS